jgi:tRNA pseudouridine55 synthase
MARRKKGVPIDGVLVVDKPTGLSSNRVVQRIKQCTRAQKVGHTGALDPMATGVLPIVFGEASKFSQFGLDADKQYLGRIQFGAATDTLDADGEVIENAELPVLTQDFIEAVLQQFRGPQTQLPPLISALKQDGQPWYKLTRQGISIERTPREVMIHELSCRTVGEGFMDIFVRCSKGTYIRTLAADLGRAFGSVAHLSQLRRVDAGGLQIDQAHSLEPLLERLASEANELEQVLRPVDTLITHLPAISLSQSECMTLIHGQKVAGHSVVKCDTMRAYSRGGQFIGLIQQDESGYLLAKRMLTPAAAGMRGSTESGPSRSGMPSKE